MKKELVFGLLLLVFLLVFGCTSFPTDTVRGIKFSDFNVSFVKSDDAANPPSDLYEIDFTIQNTGKETSTDSFAYEVEVDQGYTYAGLIKNSDMLQSAMTAFTTGGMCSTAPGSMCAEITSPLNLAPLGQKSLTIFFWVAKGTSPKYLLVERGSIGWDELGDAVLNGKAPTPELYGKVPITGTQPSNSIQNGSPLTGVSGTEVGTSSDFIEYSNTTFGFSVQVPKTFLQSCTDRSKYGNTYFDCSFTPSDKFFFFSVGSTTEDLWQTLKGCYDAGKNVDQVEINNLQGYSVAQGVSCFRINNKKTFLLKGNKNIYSINQYGDASGVMLAKYNLTIESAEKLFETMLNSFREN